MTAARLVIVPSTAPDLVDAVPHLLDYTDLARMLRLRDPSGECSEQAARRLVARTPELRALATFLGPLSPRWRYADVRAWWDGQAPPRPAEQSPDGWVYFIRSGERGPIKIGCTVGRVMARLANLQTGNPERLLLLAAARVASCFASEAALHLRFAHLRLSPRGEWFTATAELLDYVAELAALPATGEAP